MSKLERGTNRAFSILFILYFLLSTFYLILK